MNCYVHITVSCGSVFLFFFARVYRFGCVYMCACVCYTGVLSLCLHTAPLT